MAPVLRFIPNEQGETVLRTLQREKTLRHLGELWAVPGVLEFNIGEPSIGVPSIEGGEPLRIPVTQLIREALEPLGELAFYAVNGRGSSRHRHLGTSRLSRAMFLYYRWRTEFEAVLALAEGRVVLGLAWKDDLIEFTVLETVGQEQLEDRRFSLNRGTVMALPTCLWRDLEELRQLLAIELEPRERARWERFREELDIDPWPVFQRSD